MLLKGQWFLNSSRNIHLLLFIGKGNIRKMQNLENSIHIFSHNWENWKTMEIMYPQRVVSEHCCGQSIPLKVYLKKRLS